jgi:hypothetical protein
MRKHQWLVAALVLLAAAPVSALPRLATGQRLMDGASYLDVNLYAVPFVMDYYGDGKKDLLVGEFLGTAGYPPNNAWGKVRLYLNTNTDEAPLFNGWSYVQAGLPPADIQVTGKTDT